MSKSLLIHNDNTCVRELVTDHIKFGMDTFGAMMQSDEENSDNYITKTIIPKIRQKEFDIIFIKDTLTLNYLDFFGLILAYHIRLSDELGDKRFVPIVILSDLDGYAINKITDLGKILFTKNIFIAKNSIKSVEYFNRELTGKESIKESFNDEFLNLIEVDPPKDYLSHHSIANEWSMYRWAEYLDVTGNEVETIKEKIASMLYFKYLKAKFPIHKRLPDEDRQSIKGEGKILYIDDEWEKGWKSILENLYPLSSNCKLSVLQEEYKDRSVDEIIKFSTKEVREEKPDVVILDMRLHKDDFKEDVSLEELSGVKVFQKIKAINPGIQCVIFTASGNSLLLEELYSYDSSIIAYVKKEHPDDITLHTQENINKLIGKVDEGFQRSYLKDIWITSKEILEQLDRDPFKQYNPKIPKYEDHLSKLKKEVAFVFNVLNSDIKNQFNYAVVSMTRSLEVIGKIFLKDNGTLFWDGKKVDNYENKKEEILSLIKQKMNYIDVSDIDTELGRMINHRNAYMHSKKAYRPTNSESLLIWFNLFSKIIDKIMNPLPKSKEQIEEEKKEDEAERKKQKESKKPIGSPHRRIRKIDKK